MIKLEHVYKSFISKNGTVEALNNVSLEVKKGEIFGVIGYSGAGKSTLIRCVNLLERPTQGDVFVNDVSLITLTTSRLREVRKKIGMIFQGFNLLKTATVYENISIPLELTGVSKHEVKKRVDKYLSIVGLEDKHDSYPSQLSGGQKQRVGIARALSHEPEVLLSDEATSALDPETTESILDLLLKINKEFGITILLITHEMKVIQKICERVAVMENGELIEQGRVLDIFSAPQHPTTKKFVNSLFHNDIPLALMNKLKDTGPIITLSFVGESAGDPALAAVAKKFDVYPIILSGNITQLKQKPYGQLVIHLKGEERETKSAMQFLREQGIHIEGVTVDEHESIALSV